jgi:hypothetical protein
MINGTIWQTAGRDLNVGEDIINFADINFAQ